MQQMSYISELTADVCYINGVDTAVADAVSRSPVSAITSPTEIDLDKMAVAQHNNNKLRRLQETSTSLNLQCFPSPGMEGLYCDTSTCKPQPFVPMHLWHGYSHRYTRCHTRESILCKSASKHILYGPARTEIPDNGLLSVSRSSAPRCSITP